MDQLECRIIKEILFILMKEEQWSLWNNLEDKAIM
jgi:hypothetical protein